MEAPTEISDNRGPSKTDKVQSVGIMAVVGIAFTMSVLVMLGHFTRPDSDAAASAARVDNPFADPATETAGLNAETRELCQVMATTIDDINTRMSEGVTEQQARYFRSRRNKLYQMMRDRCGV